ALQPPPASPPLVPYTTLFRSPVIIFAVLFALALARVDEPRRVPLFHVIDGLAGAMQRLVSAILVLAPIGVFALAVPLPSSLGVRAARAVVASVVLALALTVLVMLAL